MVILYDRDQYDWCICHSVINGLGALHLTKMGVGFCGGACLVGGRRGEGRLSGVKNLPLKVTAALCHR